MDSMEQPVSFMPRAIRWGLIGGLISVIFSLIANTFGLLDMSKGFIMPMLVGLIGLVISVVIVVLAVREHRQEDLGGYIPFGKAFVLGFSVMVISGIISMIFSYVYGTFINPDFAAEFIEGMEVFLERQGADEKTISDALAKIKEQFSTKGMIMQGLKNTLIGGGIISAIIAAIMKKKVPEGPIA